MNYTIYSVEDDKDISVIINRTLTKQGYTVSSFYDGTSFFKAFEEKKPDLVLLDMMLPDYSGTEILQRIRSNTANDDLQVIIISAKSLVTDRVDGFDNGADDYIVKPFDLMELVARVNARFRKVKRDSSYTVGDIVLDINAHLCKNNGEVINLTVKEFEIFALLLKNRGRIVTKEEILESIWGHKDLETRALDMHIMSLRKKLNDEGLIETIHGLGYKIS